MGVKMNYGSTIDELGQMNIELKIASNDAESLTTEFQNFCDADNLDSEAYNTHKTYIENMQKPTAAGVQSFCSLMIEANQEYMDAIQDNFDGVWDIDEDKWREELEKLQKLYDAENTYLNHIMNIIGSISMFGQPTRSYDSKIQDNLDAISTTLHERLDLMEEDMKWYQEHIEKVGTMLDATNGIYLDAASMHTVVAAAIEQLGNVTITNGVYAVAGINMEPFEAIEEQQLIIQISRALKKDLGEAYKTPAEVAELDENELTAYVYRIACELSKYMPQIAAQVGNGTIEIPIGPGIYVYGGVSVASNINPKDHPVEVNLAASKNMDILCDWEMYFDVFGLSVTREGVGFENRYAVNNVTSTYIKVEYNKGGESINAEWGVKTLVDNGKGEVTTNFGLKVKEPDNYWSEVELSDYKVEYNANALQLVPDIIYENDWVVPGAPIPVPVPAIGG